VLVKQESPEGFKMLELRKSLPAYKEKERLLAAIARNQVYKLEKNVLETIYDYEPIRFL
jgi:hypothetical protein